mgnify:CR=1 FL=1
MRKKLTEKIRYRVLYETKHTMPPSRSIPKNIDRSLMKKHLYESFENHWYTMVWEGDGLRDEADIWWNQTIDWLEHVALDKIDSVVAVSVPKRPLSPTAYAESK